DVPWFEEAVVGAESGKLEAKIALMPEPAATANWLDDASAAAAFEGSRPTPAVSRPSPSVSRPSPQTSRATSQPAVGTMTASGTRITAPQPGEKPGSAQTGKTSSSRIMLVIVIILVVGL